MKSNEIPIEVRYQILRDEHAILVAECSRKDRIIEEQEARIGDLEKRLAKYERPVMNSGNSSVPPTQEPIREKVIRHTTSSRETSGRKPGGQVGHKGSTQSTNMEPTEVVEYKPHVCERCGASLEGADFEKVSSHRVLDFIVIPVCCEHAAYRCKCTCGHVNRAYLPKGKAHRSCFGPNTRALVPFLSVAQGIPFKRLCQIMEEVFHLKMSEGTVNNIIKEAGALAKYPYEVIRRLVEESNVVGADETGLYVNGKLHWAWTFQNDWLTYIFQNKSRGMKAVNEHFPDHFPNATVVSDRHSTYLNLVTACKQVCLAHILRNLEYANELAPYQDWSPKFQALLREAMGVWEANGRKPADPHVMEHLRRRLDELLEEDFSQCEHGKELETLRKGLAKWKDHFFTFLIREGVPPDNNGSERAVRNIKVKQKVSGCFRTEDGADNYVVLRSIIDTAHKNGQPLLNVLLELFNLRY